jgi:hypothetical protein
MGQDDTALAAGAWLPLALLCGLSGALMGGLVASLCWWLAC